MRSTGAIVDDGDYNVEFKIYTALSSSGSSQGSCTGDAACVWTETRTGVNRVRVVNGYLTANLGSVTALPSLNWDQELWISLNIGSTAVTPVWDGPMSPRLKLTAVPYAFTAGQLALTNGSFRSTLGFVQPTANRTIQAPDESGTICLQNSTACGFALASGGSNYIQNQNSSDQTANFRISGTGRANTSFQASLFDTAAAGTLSIGTTNATGINLDKSTTITGGITQSGGAITMTGNAASQIITTSNNALSIRAGGTAILTLNTSGAGTVNLGTDNTINVNVGGGSDVARTIRVGDPQTAGTAAQTVSVGSQRSTSTTAIQGGNGATAISLTTATGGNISIDAQGSGSGVNALLGSDGFTIKTTTDSNMAFAVQASNNDYIFSVSTTTGVVTLGALQATYSGFDGTLYAPLGTITIGQSSRATTVLGDATSTFKATSGSFTTTLGFTTPTANRTINLPNESGTVCLQGSTACSFAPASGSGNYIQNSTVVQSANFYVQAATSGTVAGIIRANAAGTGNILNLQNGAGTNVATFGSAGATTLQNSTNSVAAFQVLASVGAGGNAILRVDSTNERVAIGVITDPIGAKLSVATSTTVGFRVFQGGSADALQVGNATADFLTISSTGNVLLKPTTNSTTAFRIQNANASTTLFNADTSLSRIAIGQTSAAYTLDVAGDINSTTGLRVGTNLVCDSTGCIAKSGSGFYIQNQATVQSANMYVQAATSGSVAGVFQANAAGAGDILQLKNGAGTNVATVSSTGASAFRNSANSTSAFQVQNAAGGQLINVNSSNNIITLNGNNSAALNTWQSTSSLSTATSFEGLTVANGFVYSIGGYGSGYQATVQFARINANGTLGAWATTAALPANRAYTSAVASAGYIYVLGGTPGSGSVDTIYVAKTSPDGQIAAWQTSSLVLPAAMNAASVTVSNGYLYLLGGTTGSPVATTYYSRINGDGALSSFQSTTSLPTALANAQALVSNGYIYYIGGYNGTSAVNTVYYAPLDITAGTIGTWNSTSTLPSTHNNFGATISNGYMYTFKTGTVNYAPINANGTLGTWATDVNTIPVNYNGTNSFTYNGYHYVVGGYNGSVGTTGVYYAGGSRTYVAGTLDLVGLTMQGGNYGDDDGGAGSAGGALIAGNTNIVGTLQVQGASSFAQDVSVTGTLTVGSDLDVDDNAIITVTSRQYAGIEILSDMGNQAGETGGAFVLYAQDEWSVRSITGTVQVAGESPQGDTYTNTLSNAFLVGNYNNAAVQLGTNATVRLTVTAGGNVCIVVTTCTKTLGVSGTIAASGAITANTTPDLAETIPAAPGVEAADVVMADPNNTERVVKSDRAYNRAAVGVISDGSSSFMINSYGGSPDAPLTGKPLVLVGRVPVKITNENGSIRPGDLLTTASKPGYAMKATEAGPTIGTALGFFNGTEGEVLVLVNLGYFSPSPSNVQGDRSSMSYETLNVSGDATINRLSVSSVSVSGDASIAGNLRVNGSATVGTIVVNGHIVSKGSAPTVQVQPSAGENAQATLNGNDVSGVVTMTTGSNPTSDIIAKILFTTAYDSDARVVLTAIGRESATAQPYIDYANKSEFVIGIGQAVSAGTVLKYSYHVIQ